eukprot:2072222-Prymnesium_polylepis.1
MTRPATRRTAHYTEMRKDFVSTNVCAAHTTTTTSAYWACVTGCLHPRVAGAEALILGRGKQTQ